MTRPRKQTVDWFPHSIIHGRTIFTLEQRYGINGYAFWFKLLELLGNTEGHFLDYQDTPTAQYLQAYTHTDDALCLEILNLLTNLGAIDIELWQQRKIVWSQGFVDGLAELYARRKVDLPTKTSILAKYGPNQEIEDIIKIQEDCRKITQKAIEDGKLIKGPCEVCGTTKNIETHHPDYYKPLKVNWLCKSDHSAWHNCEQNALSAGLVLAENSLSRFIETRKLQRERVERVKREKEEKLIAPPGPSDTVGAVLFFSCPYFEVDLNYRFKLAKEYPALNDDLLRKELSKMEDWISDNAQKKKFKANGHLANPKLFIKNWFDKVGGIFGPGSDKPKGFGAVKRFMEKGEEHG